MLTIQTQAAKVLRANFPRERAALRAEALLHLAHIAQAYPRELIGGERLRVPLARPLLIQQFRVKEAWVCS